jgi:hypothetical protein
MAQRFVDLTTIREDLTDRFPCLAFMACLRPDASPEISVIHSQRLCSSARGDLPTTHRFLSHRVTPETHPIRHPVHREVRAWQPEENQMALISSPYQSAPSSDWPLIAGIRTGHVESL